MDNETLRQHQENLKSCIASSIDDFEKATGITINNINTTNTWHEVTAGYIKTVNIQITYEIH